MELLEHIDANMLMMNKIIDDNFIAWLAYLCL